MPSTSGTVISGKNPEYYFILSQFNSVPTYVYYYLDK